MSLPSTTLIFNKNIQSTLSYISPQLAAHHASRSRKQHNDNDNDNSYGSSNKNSYGSSNNDSYGSSNNDSYGSSNNSSNNNDNNRSNNDNNNSNSSSGGYGGSNYGAGSSGGGDWLDKGVSFAAQKAGYNIVRILPSSSCQGSWFITCLQDNDTAGKIGNALGEGFKKFTG